jgi:hypothetical protein
MFLVYGVLGLLLSVRIYLTKVINLFYILGINN